MVIQLLNLSSDHCPCLGKIANEMEASYEGDHVWTEVPSVNKQGQIISSGWHYKGTLVSTQIRQKSGSDEAKVVFRVSLRLSLV